MRIQHNITAMNAYQNYNRNTKALAKNLEKLSSGYRINRAGDDAAGLAISEKMRAQITGLEVAQKNAKDGISLVQTAEGGMEEVHDMLNRMYSLAEQSRNGTYQDEVDREQMQKEITSLKEEINRISESVNFNGIKLLDGSLDSGSVSVSDNLTVTNDEVPAAAGAALGAGAGRAAGDPITKTAAFNPSTTASVGDTWNYSVAWKDSTGAAQTTAIQFKLNDATTLRDMTNRGADVTVTAGNITADKFAEIVANALNDDATFKGELKATANADGTISFAAQAAKTATVTGLTPDTGLGGGVPTTTNTNTNNNTNPADAPNPDKGSQKVDLGKIKVLDGTNPLDKDDVEKNTFEINGKKFLLVNGLDGTAALEKNIEGVDKDVNVIRVAQAAAGDYDASGTNDAELIASEVSRVTGLTFTGTAGDTKLSHDYNSKSERLAESEVDANGDPIKVKRGLSLQIGDTAEDFNQMTVQIMSVDTKSLGIDGINVGNQEDAGKAMDLIKAAINKVSSGRGDLGALQNRLDHTINNLATMHENIQDAEATIRDVDVAEEMMAYTKNNILVQSAQAMLAQANQLPQGVLQLLG